MDEIFREIRVGEGAIDARERVPELDVQSPRAPREGERRRAIERALVDDVILVGDPTAREILSRLGAGGSAVLVVEDDHEGIRWWS